MTPFSVKSAKKYFSRSVSLTKWDQIMLQYYDPNKRFYGPNKDYGMPSQLSEKLVFLTLGACIQSCQQCDKCQQGYLANALGITTAGMH